MRRHARRVLRDDLQIPRRRRGGGSLFHHVASVANALRECAHRLEVDVARQKRVSLSVQPLGRAGDEAGAVALDRVDCVHRRLPPVEGDGEAFSASPSASPRPHDHGDEAEKHEADAHVGDHARDERSFAGLAEKAIEHRVVEKRPREYDGQQCRDHDDRARAAVAHAPLGDGDAGDRQSEHDPRDDGDDEARAVGARAGADDGHEQHGRDHERDDHGPPRKEAAASCGMPKRARHVRDVRCHLLSHRLRAPDIVNTKRRDS